VIIEKTRQSLKDQPMGLKACDTLSSIVEHSESFNIKPYLLVDLGLARGLDYYTGPVFEVYAEGYEDAGSIAGGGRYDDLVELFGGESTPMTGISMGIDRLMPLLDEMGIFKRLDLGPKVYIATITDNLVPEAIKVAQRLREAGIKTDLDLIGRGLRKQLDNANKKGFKKVVIVGEKELREGSVVVRDMETSKQKKVKIEAIVKEI
jgi:histidyl-tRNA synthetase